MNSSMIAMITFVSLAQVALVGTPTYAQENSQWKRDGGLYYDPSTVVNQKSDTNSTNSISIDQDSITITSQTTGTDRSHPTEARSPNLINPGMSYAKYQVTIKQNYVWGGSGASTESQFIIDVWGGVSGSTSQTGHGNSAALSKGGLEISQDIGSCSSPGSTQTYKSDLGDPTTSPVKNTLGETTCSESWVISSSASGTGSLPATWSALAKASFALTNPEHGE